MGGGGRGEAERGRGEGGRGMEVGEMGGGGAAAWFPPYQLTTATAIGCLIGKMGSGVAFDIGTCLGEGGESGKGGGC